MAIAKVEPLTTARALRGPFDYLLSGPFRGGRGRHRAAGPVRPAPGARGGGRDRRAQRIAARAARRADRGARGRASRPSWSASGSGSAREYCSTPARGLELVLPPGHADAPAARPGRLSETIAVRRRAGVAPRRSAGLGPRQRARARAARRRARGRAAAASLAAEGIGRDALRRLERRGLVELRDREPLQRRPRVAADRRRRRRRSTSTADQRAAVAPDHRRRSTAAARELLLAGVTGLGQDRGLPGGRAEAALDRGRGAIVLVPEIGLTPQAMRRFAVALRRPGRGAPLPASARASAATSGGGCARRGADLRRAALGDLRSDRRPRADRDRRGARRLLQAGGRPALRRPRGRPPAGRRLRRRRSSCGSATPRPESWAALERVELPRRVDGRALPAVEVARHARPRRRAPARSHDRTREALAELRAARRQGDRARQPSRLGAASVAAARAATSWQCPSCDVSLVAPPPHRRCTATTAATPSPSPRPARLRLGDPRPRRRRERAGRGAASPTRSPRCRSSGSTPTAPPARVATSRSSTRFSAPTAASWSALRWSPRATTSPTSSSGWSSTPTRRCGSPTSAPRSARSRSSPSSPAAAGADDRGGRVLVQTLSPDADAIRYAAAHDARRLPRRRARAPARARLPAVLAPDPHRAHAAPRSPRLERAAGGLREALDASLPAGAQVLGPAPRFRLRGRERRQLLVKATDRRSGGGGGPRGGRGGRLEARARGISRSPSTSTLSERAQIDSKRDERDGRTRGRQPRRASTTPPSAAELTEAEREARARGARRGPDLSATRCCARAPRR